MMLMLMIKEVEEERLDRLERELLLFDEERDVGGEAEEDGEEDHIGPGAANCVGGVGEEMGEGRLVDRVVDDLGDVEELNAPAEVTHEGGDEKGEGD